MISTMFRGFTRGVLCLCLFATVGIAQAAENGLLWKIEAPDGKYGYLFGTMHTDDRRVTNVSPKVIEAVKDADSFVMETIAPNNPGFYLMKDAKLSEFLVEKEFDKVHELADFHSMHMEAAMRMKPWLLAVIFDMPKPQAFDTQDESLAAIARDNAKEILGLEDPQEHFAVLDDLTIDEQLVMLRAVLNRTQKQKERDFESLVKAYLKGDTGKIAALDEKITGGMLPKELWAKMHTKLIDERNEVMAERIQAQLNESTSFFALGASHLAGETGLIARLRTAGYKLTAIH